VFTKNVAREAFALRISASTPGHARFTCDVLHTAVLKDAAVAVRIGGRVFDCVFRYTPAEDGKNIRGR